MKKKSKFSQFKTYKSDSDSYIGVMNHKALILQNFTDLASVLTSFTNQDLDEIEDIAVKAAARLRAGGTVFWCGNGGSAADSIHLSAELIGRLVNNRRPLSSIALNSDIAAITCISNDFGFQEIFSRQLEGLAHKNDFVIVLSTSGNSENIIRCIMKAKDLGVPVAALLGKGGGKALSMADFEIVVNSQVTARIQEAHKVIGHSICQIIERELGFNN